MTIESCDLPDDTVDERLEIHADSLQKCKKAIGMHWGTWRMALDRITEPAERLGAARDQVGLTSDQFGLLALGETKGYDP